MVNRFEIDAYRKGRELFIILRGNLVLQHCQDAKTRLHGLFIPQIDQIYLYLGELSFLDSAGLGVLVGIKMAATQNRTRITFLSPPSRVEDIFRISKLDAIFEVRGGAEADVLRAALCQPEYCLWRDSKDVIQTGAATDPSRSGSRSQPAPTPPAEAGDSEVSRRARAHCDDAVEFIRQGDYEKAIVAYRRALALEPDSLSALNNLGIIYEKRPEWYRAALETWRKVLDLSQARQDEKHALRARRHLDSLEKLLGAN
jgi:anti-anti-sigma factor